MAPHPAVIAAQKAALDKAKGKTAADNRQEIKDQASAALATSSGDGDSDALAPEGWQIAFGSRVSTPARGSRPGSRAKESASRERKSNEKEKEKANSRRADQGDAAVQDLRPDRPTGGRRPAARRRVHSTGHFVRHERDGLLRAVPVRGRARRAEPGGAATGAGADGARVAAERKSSRGGAGPCGPRADGRIAGRGALNRMCKSKLCKSSLTL